MKTKTAPKVETLVVDNFGGRLVPQVYGKINSGYALVDAGLTYSNDPFTYPGQLTWFESPTQIDPTGAVITDLIMAGKERVEGGTTYVYQVGHTGRVYKTQVNNPSIYNPDYDNPVLLCTLSSNSPTFTRGGSIDFFGATERIYIGHDMGLTMLNFDGTGETFVGVLGSWAQNVPRPLKQFVGNLIVGNGNNIAKIIDPSVVSSYGQLNPAFPNNTQVRDLDLSVDGNYLQAVVSRLALPDITLTTQDDKFLANTESYIAWWNGSDIGTTSLQTYPSFSLNANATFGAKQYIFGYDLVGAAVFTPTEKILSHFLAKAPLPNSMGSNGNIIGWTVPEFSQGVTKASLMIFGSLDRNVPIGWWRQFSFSAQGTETDVVAVPYQQIVSNFVLGSSTNGYGGGVASTAKVYFSTLEVSSSPTTKYKLYKFHPVPTGQGTPVGSYQTQIELFSKKIKISEIRIYTSPLVAGNGFNISVVNSYNRGTGVNNTLSSSTKNFTANSNATIGDDLVKYNPASPPTYGIGLNILNTGTTNMVFKKIEIDYSSGGE